MPAVRPVQPRAEIRISDRVLEILTDAEITANLVRIPEKLDRRDYDAVNKALKSLGGNWNRWKRAHVFATDAAEVITPVLEEQCIPASDRVREGHVPTPPALAAEIVRTDTGLGDRTTRVRVLEPSAGEGVFVRAILEVAADVSVVAVEPNTARVAQIPRDTRVRVYPGRFEDFAAARPAPFDLIVMNPPFSTTDDPAAWIDHLHLAWDLLAPGGRIVAILPSGLDYRTDSRHTGARALVTRFGRYRELPPDAFAPSGTTRITVLAWLIRPGTRLP